MNVVNAACSLRTLRHRVVITEYMEEEIFMDDRLAKGIDRRTFLRMLGIASGALFVPGAIACGGGSSNTPTTSGACQHQRRDER